MRSLTSLVLVCGLVWLNPVAVADGPSVTQDGLGLLHGTFTRVTKPIQEHDLPALGYVGQFLVTPDGRKVVCHCWSVDEKFHYLDRVVVMDVATARVEKVLDEGKVGIVERAPMHLTADGKRLLMGQSDGVDEFDVASGKLVKQYFTPKDQLTSQHAFSDDDKKVVGITEDGGAVILDLSSDKSMYVKLDLPKDSSRIAYPLAGRDELLVGVKKKGDGEKSRITLVDPKTMKATLLSEFEGNTDMRPTSDGKRVYVFRGENPMKIVWTSIEEWNPQTIKMNKKQQLQPPLSCIGMKVSHDGSTVFLHEYLARPVILWNLNQGRFLAAVGPDLGGCQAFDMTPDGKKVVAFVGPWIDGTLVPKKLAVYDTSALVSGAALSNK